MKYHALSPIRLVIPRSLTWTELRKRKSENTWVVYFHPDEAKGWTWSKELLIGWCGLSGGPWNALCSWCKRLGIEEDPRESYKRIALLRDHSVVLTDYLSFLLSCSFSNSFHFIAQEKSSIPVRVEHLRLFRLHLFSAFHLLFFSCIQ